MGMSFTNIFSQANDKANINALSFELGKSGLIYNVSFDHKFKSSGFGGIIKVGSNLSEYLNLKMVGGGVYRLVGKEKNFLELGLELNYLSVDEVSDDQKGFTLIYPDYTIKTYYVTTNIGYRNYGEKGLFRIGFSPGFIKGGTLIGGYISYGFTF